MLCQRCNHREASVHVMQIKNNRMRELHLCAGCAAKQFTPDIPTGKQLLKLFRQSQHTPDFACPLCGATLLDFQRTGYVGCPQCYEIFDHQMEPMLMAVHGATRHIGQEEPPQDGTVKQRDELEGLREQLNQAVREERFEQAAILRDKLREAEHKAAVLSDQIDKTEREANG